MLDEAVVKRLALMYAVVLLSEFGRNLNKLEGGELESTLLETGQYVTDYATLYALRFDDNKCLLHEKW
jgi:hypothetical protein